VGRTKAQKANKKKPNWFSKRSPVAHLLMTTFKCFSEFISAHSSLSGLEGGTLRILFSSGVSIY